LFKIVRLVVRWHIPYPSAITTGSGEKVLLAVKIETIHKLSKADWLHFKFKSIKLIMSSSKTVSWSYPYKEMGRLGENVVWGRFRKPLITSSK
jgi:hypothetical protein